MPIEVFEIVKKGTANSPFDLSDLRASGKLYAEFAYGFRFEIPVPVSGITSGTVVIGGGGEFVVSDITFNGGTIQSESLADSISVNLSSAGDIPPNYYFVGDTVRYSKPRSESPPPRK